MGVVLGYMVPSLVRSSLSWNVLCEWKHRVTAGAVRYAVVVFRGIFILVHPHVHLRPLPEGTTIPLSLAALTVLIVVVFPSRHFEAFYRSFVILCLILRLAVFVVLVSAHLSLQFQVCA